MNQQDGNEIRMSADALIALVMAEAEAREMAAMPGPEAMGAAFQPSQRFEKKMRRLLRQARWKKKKREALRAARRMFVVVTTVVTVFTCMLMPARAVREAVVSTVMNWQEQFVEVVFTENESQVTSAELDVNFTYVPEGFALVGQTSIGNGRFLAKYRAGSREWYTIRGANIKGNQATALDSEYVRYYYIEFMNKKAIWGIMKDGSNEIVWDQGGIVFHISGSLNISEMLRVAESVTTE